MTVNFTDAVSAYQRLVKGQAEAGLAARDKAPDGDFADALRAATGSAVDALRGGETETLKAAAGKADINEVVLAVSQAEITLQTVVAVRDRVIQAYQEILRMPI
jgi:flagellar hook-basal body complex protein FliE